MLRKFGAIQYRLLLIFFARMGAYGRTWIGSTYTHTHTHTHAHFLQTISGAHPHQAFSWTHLVFLCVLRISLWYGCILYF